MNVLSYQTPAAFRQALMTRLNRAASARDLPPQTLVQRFVMERMLARLFRDETPPWILKGGFALDLRFRPRARTTRDLDLVTVEPTQEIDELRRLIQDALSHDGGDFLTFTVGRSRLAETEAGLSRSVRFSTEVQLAGKLLAAFKVDVGLDDLIIGNAESVRGEDVYGIEGLSLPTAQLLSVSQHFAEKLHTLTRPWTGRENTRVKDLVDLVLLIERGDLQPRSVIEAVRRTFHHRATHLVPTKLLEPPDSWRRDYAPLSAQADLDAAEIDEGIERLQDWLEEHRLQETIEMTHSRQFTFEDAFETLTGHPPFPWQTELFRRFTEDPVPDHLPAAANIPTGLGKTSVVAIWLLAWLQSPERMPRRLAYVVNRRTVVDQTTREVERIRDRLDHLAWPDLQDRIGPNGLAISTLRGQFADNRAWSADPSLPAVVCGTVDMVGSRLLFSGYGLGFKSRPLHAGFLGQDALLVHDEAHLEPAFQRLIETIAEEQGRDGDRQPLRIMQLTATARGDAVTSPEGGSPGPPADRTFTLTDEERRVPADLPDPPTQPIHHVWRRIAATKQLQLVPVKDEKADLIPQLSASLAEYRDSKDAILVFVRRIEDAYALVKKLTKKKKGEPPISDTDHVAALTGTIRGLERDALVKTAVFRRFLGQKPEESIEGTVFLICTSAGEVGVDLSADHMVCDLSTFDSIAQRLGRVNRYGKRDDTVVQVVYPAIVKTDKKDELTLRRKATLALLRQLNGDASPRALEALPATARQAAFAPPPNFLDATDILFDTWAMTSVQRPLAAGPLPGCPPVAPYLHGLSEWEPPQTRVAWRTEVQWFNRLPKGTEPESLLSDYPLKPHELLTERTDRVKKQLDAALDHFGDADPTPELWVLDGRNTVRRVTLRKLLKPETKTVVIQLTGTTILMPPSLKILTEQGRLDADAKPLPGGEDRYDVADQWLDEKQRPRRHRERTADTSSAATRGMRLIRRIPLGPETPAGGEPEADRDGPPETWDWYARPRSADDEGSFSALQDQKLEDHLHLAGQHARGYADRLRLAGDEKAAVIFAARYHDLGKDRERWQAAVGNFDDERTLAKSAKRMEPAVLAGYRHEFGSVLDVLAGGAADEWQKLSDHARDLALHLIAAHHGRARPHFPVREVQDSAPNRGEAALELATETPRRFARLQRHYGRWGLAWLESLVRAADYAASEVPAVDDDADASTPQEAAANV